MPRISLRGGGSGTTKGNVALVTWDQATVRYVVVSARKQGITIADWGRFALGSACPPWQELRELIAARDIAVEQLVVLAPRSELEMVTVEVPDSEGDELSSLVQGEVEGQVGDGDQELAIDYHVLSRAVGAAVGKAQPEGAGGEVGDGASTLSAVAYVIDEGRLRVWREQAAEHQWQLLAVTSRQLAPLAALAARREIRGRASVLVSVFAGEVELSFFRGERLVFLRTFRAAASSSGALAEQIQLELQRSLSMMELAPGDESPEVVLVERDDLEWQGGQAAEASGEDGTDPLLREDDEEWRPLSDQLEARLARLDLPLEPGVRVGDRATVSPDTALVGAAIAVLSDGLAVDVLHPKRPAVPVSPLKRWGVIGGFAIVSLLVVGWVLWSDVNALREQLDGGVAELEQAEEVAAKLQEKGDQAKFVQQWLDDQVDWLERLRVLSAQFPDGQGANVRRLTAAVGEGSGVFDLSIQVSDPTRVAELENRIRAAGFSITSQQISEQTGNSEYPWQFQAKVAFEITPISERDEDLVLMEDLSLALTTPAQSAPATSDVPQAAAPAAESGAEAEEKASREVSEPSEDSDVDLIEEVDSVTSVRKEAP